MVVLAAAFTLAAGFALKAQCLQPWSTGVQFRRLCYNDVQALWAIRGIDTRVFPYVHGELRSSDGEPAGGAIEYPVLTGLFMWAAGAAADDADEYLVHSALLLAPFGLLTAWLLGRLAELRALLWAAAPAIVLYAFHNWELLVVAATVAGFYLWHRGAPAAAALLLGVGAAVKVYPALFLAPLALDVAVGGDRRRALGTFAAGVGAFAAVNLPFALVNFEGWWATYAFHRARGPNFDSIWNLTDAGIFSVPKLAPATLNVITGALMAAFFVVALLVGWLSSRGSGRYPVLPVSAALLAAFLLWNKVHSPQYTMWIMPFFVLVAVPLAWWIAYTLVDLLVYVGVFRFFYDYAQRGVLESPAQDAMEVGVWLRAVLLFALFVVFLTSSSQPLATVRRSENRSELPGRRR